MTNTAALLRFQKRRFNISKQGIRSGFDPLAQVLIATIQLCSGDVVSAAANGHLPGGACAGCVGDVGILVGGMGSVGRHGWTLYLVVAEERG